MLVSAVLELVVQQAERDGEADGDEDADHGVLDERLPLLAPHGEVERERRCC